MWRVRAVHTFAAEHSDELEFEAGEEIEILEKDDAFGDGWWRGRNTKGEEGLFPATYITGAPASPELPPSPEPSTAVTGLPSPRGSAVSEAQPVRSSSAHARDEESPRGGTAPLPPPIALDNESPHGGASPLPIVVPAQASMGTTIDSVQRAIDESMTKHPDSDEEEEFGINQNARARLAAQAKLANEQREKHRASGGVTGLVYSDESDDEDEEPRQSLTGKATMLNGNTQPLSASPRATSISSANGVPNEAANVKSPIESPSRSLDDSSRGLQPPLPIPSTPPTRSETGGIPTKPPSAWTVDEVVAWATTRGFDEQVRAAVREHDITGDLLLELDANLLKELDIPQFGKRLRIAQAISELRRPASMISSSSRQSPGVSAAPTVMRGMSAPPGGIGPASTPPLSSAGAEDGAPHAAWAHSRKTSLTVGPPTMDPIREGRPPSPTLYSSVSTTPSVPASPLTPSSTTTKRESTGSIGHKRGKPSLGDSKDRLSFFGRARKPAPTTMSPGDQRNFSRPISSSDRTHQVQPARPQGGRRSSGGNAPAGTALALRQIGSPDYSGYLKKKGERYGSWKSRFFVLKGSHLYYLKDESEDRVKGHIDLKGYRVIVDENTNPGSYGFRLMGQDKPHYFSSSEQMVVREWMKALMKATIARDYNAPVTSSCNIPTIPLAEAQALAPRPPSPATRDAMQRANRRENVNQLTAHDASVLMSLDTSRRVSQNLNTPSRPIRDTRRSSSNVQTISNVDAERYSELLHWTNSRLPPPYPKASSLPGSFASGEVIFLLVGSLSGIEPSPPVPPNAFASENGMPGIPGLFAMMDILIDAGVDTAGVSINDIRSGDANGIARLVESVRSWADQRA